MHDLYLNDSNRSFIKSGKFKVKPELNYVSTIKLLQYDQLKGWQQLLKLKTNLVCNHCLTNYSLEVKQGSSQAQIPPAYISCVDLEQVDYKHILVGRKNGIVSIHDTSTPNNKQKKFSCIAFTKKSYVPSVYCLQWYPRDAGLFTTSSFDQQLTIWDPNRMKPVDKFTLNCIISDHHMSPVASNHSLIAVASNLGEIVLCDLRTSTSTHRMHGHEGMVNLVQWGRRDGHILASGGRDGTVRLWDIRAGRSCLNVLREREKFCGKVHNPRRYARGQDDSGRSGRRRGCVDGGDYTGGVRSLCFTPDGLYLLSKTQSEMIAVWNPYSGVCKAVYRCTAISGKHSNNLPCRMAIAYGSYPDIAYIPCGSSVYVLDLSNGNVQNILKGHFSPVSGVLFNPITSALYTYSPDNNFLVWLIQTQMTKDSVQESKSDALHLPQLAATNDDWSSDED